MRARNFCRPPDMNVRNVTASSKRSCAIGAKKGKQALLESSWARGTKERAQAIQIADILVIFLHKWDGAGDIRR